MHQQDVAVAIKSLTDATLANPEGKVFVGLTFIGKDHHDCSSTSGWLVSANWNAQLFHGGGAMMGEISIGDDQTGLVHVYYWGEIKSLYIIDPPELSAQ